jgi:hypothetical protein
VGVQILITAIALVLMTGCSSALVETTLYGMWGGDHISFQIGEAEAIVELDCALGAVPVPIRTDKTGRFEAEGTLVLGRGGPVRLGEPEDRHPAVYSGHVVGDTMTLAIDITDMERAEQTYVLRRGEQGRLFRCL